MRRYALLAIAVVVLVLVGGMALASNGQVINACVKSNGLTFIVADLAECGPNDVPLTWNVEGQQGPQGEQGESGPSPIAGYAAASIDGFDNTGGTGVLNENVPIPAGVVVTDFVYASGDLNCTSVVQLNGEPVIYASEANGNRNHQSFTTGILSDGSTLYVKFVAQPGADCRNMTTTYMGYVPAP